MEERSSFDLRRKGGLPIYLQVKRRIESLISSGQWKRGQRLPTERALAAELGVSRNTVSLAYRRFEAEGLITSRQGRGTFVAEADDILRMENKRERLNRVIDSALDDALALGVNPDEFLQVVTRRGGRTPQDALRRENRLRRVQQGSNWTTSARSWSRYRCEVLPVLTDDLSAGRRKQERRLPVPTWLSPRSFISTKCGRPCPERSEDVLGIALDPDMETIVRIARLPPGSDVLLVCISERFAERVRKSMENAGITEVNVETVTGKDPAIVRDR